MSSLLRSSLFLSLIGHMLPAVATTVPIVSCSVDQPQLFTNPSFEDGTLDGWTYTSSGANAVVVSADSSSSAFTAAADGEYYIDTHNTQPRGADALFLRQTLYDLDTSMTYTISFSMAAASSNTGTNYCYIYVFKDSQTNANLLKEFQQITITSSGLPWTEYSFDFQPSSESHLIFFVPECTGSTHVGFDNFEFLQPATTLCSTSYSTVPTTSSTLSSSLVSSQPVVTTPVASSGVVSSSPAVSSAPHPIHSSSALVSATSVAPTQPSIASSSHSSPPFHPSSSRSALASISSGSMKPTSTAAPAHTSPSSTMVSVSRIRSASRSPSARTSSPLVSASSQSNQPSSASRVSSSPVVVATIVPSSVASTGRVPDRSTIRASSLALSSSSPSLSKTSPVSSTPLFISSTISRSISPSALLSAQSTALSSLSPSSPIIKATPVATSEASASLSESVPCETPTQTEPDNSQPTSASAESGYTSVETESTVTASSTSTASNSSIGNGSEGVTVTETSLSTTPTQLIGAETSVLVKSGDYHVSSSTMLVTKTVTVSRSSGDAVTEIVYQTVVECPEAEQTSSLAISAHITGSTGDGGSDTTSTALPSYTTLSTGSAGTGSAGTGSSDTGSSGAGSSGAGSSDFGSSDFGSSGTGSSGTGSSGTGSSGAGSSGTGSSGTGSSDFSASFNSSGKVSPETSSIFFSGHSTANADDAGFETASTVLSGSPSLTTGSPDNSGSFSSSGDSSESSVVPNGTVDSETVTYVSTTFASSRPLRTAVHTPSFSHAPSPYGTDFSQSIEGSTTSWSVSPMASPSSAVYTGFGTRVENRSTLAIVVISLFMLASLL